MADRPIAEIKTPIKVRIPGLDHPDAWKTFNEIEEFADNEVAVWRAIRDDLAKLGVQELSAIDHVLAQYSKLQRGAAGNDRSQCQKLLVSIAKEEIVTSSTPLGQTIVELGKEDPIAALGAISMAVGMGLPSDAWLVKTLRGAVDYELNRLGIVVGSAAREREALELLRVDWDERLGSYVQQHESAIAQMEAHNRDLEVFFENQKERVNKFVDELETGVEALKRTYQEDLRLRAPSDYWDERDTDMRRTAQWAGGAFIVLVVIFICIIFGFEESIIDGLPKKKDDELTFGALAFLTIPALAFFWILRHVSRLFVSSLQEASDARLRKTMTMTFLALMGEEQTALDPKERLLVLQALFRPIHPVQTDEAGPPSLLEAIFRTRGRDG